MLGTGAWFFTCIFHYIFTATICFIMISLFYDEKLRRSEIERVALVVELISGGVGFEPGLCETLEPMFSGPFASVCQISFTHTPSS